MATLDIPCPEGLSFRSFQKEGIHFALHHHHSLNADDMGLGKTIQAIGVINADQWAKNVLIVCPSFLKINWKREVKAWCTRKTKVILLEGRTPSALPDTRRTRIVVVGYDVLKNHRPELDKVEWDILIVDEAHYCKSPKAQRTVAVLGGKIKKSKEPTISLAPIKARRRLFLTGTPILNRPIDLWPLVRSLDPNGLGKSFTAYTSRHCKPRWTRWGIDFSGSANLEELGEKLRPFMIRRLKKDVLTELPPKQYQIIELPAERAESLLAQEIAEYDTYEHYLKEGQTKAATIAFTKLSEQRQKIALFKVPQIVEHLQESLTQNPVVCFAYHTAVIDAIAKALNTENVITGDTPMKTRQDRVDAFQQGHVDIIIGNIKAMGVGYNLTRAQQVVFAELDWTPALLSQAEDRCHRIGQKENLLIQHLVLAKSLDAKMVKVLVKKQRLINTVLG